MKVYLGTKGSESLITNENRIFADSDQEGYEDVEMEDRSIMRYTTDTIKKGWNISFPRMTSANYDVLYAEYAKKTALNLKIEKTTPDTYDEYTVLFDGSISKALFKDLVSVRRYADVSFTLREA